MRNTGYYDADDSMSTLICDNHAMLLVLSRFNIPLGFGDATIGEVCDKNGVDTATFLAVVHLLSCDEEAVSIDDISPLALVQYLQHSHSYFIGYRLPAIRAKLAASLEPSNHDIVSVILNYFDQYVEQVKKHMVYEENTVFPYVSHLFSSSDEKEKYRIDIFKDRHDNIDNALSELKDIIIRYCPSGSTNALNDALFDIFICAEDLASHNKVEDRLLIPCVKRAEQAKTTIK